MSKKPHILIIYTGGTIGMVKNYQTKALQAFDFEYLYKSIPELKQLHCTFEHISFELPIDSSNMNVNYWNDMLEVIKSNYDRVDGFVILHGSDTMAYTASALSFMISNLDKPIILTGSQLPIGDLRTDARENMITALEIAATQYDNKPVIQEVCIYFEYKLYRGNRTTKVSATQFKAFDSPNYPVMAESGVELKFNDYAIPILNHHNTTFKFLEDKPILLIKLYPSLQKEVLLHQLNTLGLKGVIIETYGSGNAPTERWFLEAIKQTLDKNIPVVNITQCFGGSVVLGKYETSLELLNMGMINGQDITTESAVTKLIYLLNITEDLQELKQIFETSIRGEIRE